MSAEAYRYFYSAMEARRNAHFLLRSNLPGRLIYFRMGMRRAILKWQQFSKARKAEL